MRAQDKRDRIDLTDVPLVTIDGEDARDFDDAVYCEPARIGKTRVDNGWRLLVAIADVSHYIENGAAIDIDAYDRALRVADDAIDDGVTRTIEVPVPNSGIH